LNQNVLFVQHQIAEQFVEKMKQNNGGKLLKIVDI